MASVRFLLLTLLFPPAVSNVRAVLAQEPSHAIRVSVDRVNVGVIVTDAGGHFVEGLRRESFRIFDNDVEQPVTNFTSVDEPAQVLLLLEAGPAVYLFEGGHLQAAYALFRGLAAADRVAIVQYAEAPHLVLDFTSDKQAAVAALDAIQFNLGFGSLNLSSSLEKVLEWESNVQGKKTIVLLSTGIDTSTPESIPRVLQQLKLADLRVLVVSLAGPLQSKPLGGKKKLSTQKSVEAAEEFALAAQLLRQVAEASGGRAYFPVTVNDFGAVYSEIAQLVRHEYSLAFAPPARDGLVHSIEVRVAAPSSPASAVASLPYRPDYRRAYLAPAP